MQNVLLSKKDTNVTLIVWPKHNENGTKSNQLDNLAWPKGRNVAKMRSNAFMHLFCLLIHILFAI